MRWQAREKGLVRVVVRLATGVFLGAVPGALYAGLVGAVHLALYRRWDWIPAFAVGCVLAGALAGLLGGVAWALAGDTAAARGWAAPPGRFAARWDLPQGLPGPNRLSETSEGLHPGLQWQGMFTSQLKAACWVWAHGTVLHTCEPCRTSGQGEGNVGPLSPSAPSVLS